MPRALWHNLAGGYSVLCGRQRRSGAARSLKFLVLAPRSVSTQLRKTLCSGVYADGRCVIERGCITLDLRAELGRWCAVESAKKL